MPQFELQPQAGSLFPAEAASWRPVVPATKEEPCTPATPRAAAPTYARRSSCADGTGPWCPPRCVPPSGPPTGRVRNATSSRPVNTWLPHGTPSTPSPNESKGPRDDQPEHHSRVAAAADEARQPRHLAKRCMGVPRRGRSREQQIKLQVGSVTPRGSSRGARNLTANPLVLTMPASLLREPYSLR